MVINETIKTSEAGITDINFQQSLCHAVTGRQCPKTREIRIKLTKLKWLTIFYKITGIVRTLWLAERSVCMRVCKHDCRVKLFGFSRANHASTNLKKFSSSKLDKFTLFTHSSVCWNMENRYNEGESIFLRLSWHFKREKSVFCKALFAKQELITRARLRGQDFATGKNFSFNQCHTKSFAFFSRESCFIKAIENFFPVFA